MADIPISFVPGLTSYEASNFWAGKDPGPKVSISRENGRCTEPEPPALAGDSHKVKKYDQDRFITIERTSTGRIRGDKSSQEQHDSISLEPGQRAL